MTTFLSVEAVVILHDSSTPVPVLRVTLLRINGVVLERVTDVEGLRLLRGDATGDVKLEDLASWLAAHNEPQRRRKCTE